MLLHRFRYLLRYALRCARRVDAVADARHYGESRTGAMIRALALC